MPASPSVIPARLSADDLVLERDGRRVLDGIDLDVEAGRVTALLGPSGSGKTSLLRCLVRFEEPSSGEVRLDGDDVRELDPCRLRREVGLVAQAPVMFAGDVAANLALGLSPAPGPRRIDETLAAVGLDPVFAHRDARALSGGEGARVAIARALIREPRALLLDEPTAALDGRAAATVEVLLVTLAARGLAVLVVTHDEAAARRVATTAVRLRDGRIDDAPPARRRTAAAR